MSARRTYVVTGSASGIGAATRALLEAAGERVIGVDRRDADILADLSTIDGRQAMVAAVTAASDGTIDGVIACAGISSRSAGTSPAAVVHVNFFGAQATLVGLRPLLAASASPRATAIASIAGLEGQSESLVDALLAGDEESLTETMVGIDHDTAYRSSKRALARWVRREAPSATWAGAGIALNAIAPGVIETPMSRDWLDQPDQRAQVLPSYPQPLAPGGVGQPEQVAEVLVWLTSERNALVTGQILYVDGGYEAIVRGDNAI